MPGHNQRQHITGDLPYKLYVGGCKKQLPDAFNWQNYDGENHLTRSTNQHLPTYCGSCWAHSAMSVLADRIKIIRMQFLRDDDEEFDEDGSYPDVHLSIQFLLNCGSEIAGSCHGGKTMLHIRIMLCSVVLHWIDQIDQMR